MNAVKERRANGATLPGGNGELGRNKDGVSNTFKGYFENLISFMDKRAELSYTGREEE